MVALNGGIHGRIRVKVLANAFFPEVNAIVLNPCVDRVLVEVEVTEGTYAGCVWRVLRDDIELIAEPSVNAQEGVSNTPPNSHDNVKPTPNLKDSTSKVTPDRDIHVYEPGSNSKRLRRELASRSVTLAAGGKGFGKPLLCKARIDAVARIQDRIDDVTQLVQEGEGLRVHVDYLQGTGGTRDMDRLLRCLADFLGETVYVEKDSPRMMGRMWQHSGKCTNGFVFLARERCEEEGGGYHVWLGFPGALLSSRPVRHWWKMAKALRRLINFKATRFDSALDDYDKTVTAEQVREAIEAGNVKGIDTSRPNSYEFRDTAGGGWTNTLGAPKSRSRLCHYNKEAQTRGLLKCYRLELRLREGYAAKAFDDWLAFGSKGFEEVSAFYLAGLVVSYYDFRDRSAKPNEKNFTRLPRYDWWQKLIDKIGVGSDNLRHSLPRRVFSIERSMRWINRQVVTSLVVLKYAMGEAAFWDWLRKQMSRAEEFRLTRWHWHLISTFETDVDSFVA